MAQMYRNHGTDAGEPIHICLGSVRLLALSSALEHREDLPFGELPNSQMTRNSQVIGCCIPLKYSRTEMFKLQSKIAFRIFFFPLEMGFHRHGFGPHGHLPQAQSTKGFFELGQWNVFSRVVCYITALCMA